MAMRLTRKNDVLIICDLDNTLYDWYGYFVPSIYALIEVAAEILHCDQHVLMDDLRAVHQKHHDSEHPFALLETARVRECFPHESPDDVFRRLNPAFYAFNKSRKVTLKLFDDVLETLRAINSVGGRIVAHTESKMFGAVDRINRLGLEPFLTKIYCRQETVSDHPNLSRTDKWLKEFSWGKVTRLPLSDVKPNARIIRDICKTEGVDVRDVIYIGDSFARDMLMAKQAGAFAVWAEYGAKPHPSMYEKLVRISHWTAEDVAREKVIREQAAAIKPDFVCKKSFKEVLAAIQLFAESRQFLPS
jgi:phosphoglycolate phosphatase